MLDFRRAATAALWIGGAALLLLAANLKHPQLLPVRPWELPVLMAGGAAGVALACRRTVAGRLLAALWIAAPLVGLFELAAFHRKKYAVLAASGPSAQQLGRHFIVGYHRAEEVEPLVARGLVGGVFLTTRNARGRTAPALRDEIARLQGLRRDAGLPPLIVATDQEGGMVSRLSPPLSRQPPLADVAALPAADRSAAAHDYGAAQGRELAGIGITVDFAPVVDLGSDLSPNPFDLHSRIPERAISTDPAIVAEVALAYSRGLQSTGVTPTLKHFPGLGRVRTDTHHFSATHDTPVAVLAASDWIPFRAVAAQGGSHIMVGHVALATLDPQRPASLSQRVVQGLLRDGWGFDGVVITDDLTMGAVYSRGICGAAVEALNAGVDLLLIAYDAEQYYRAMACVLAAYRQGRLDQTLLNRSAARLTVRPG
jgi:beta-N-acetylhexosaminidase